MSTKRIDYFRAMMLLGLSAALLALAGCGSCPGRSSETVSAVKAEQEPAGESQAPAARDTIEVPLVPPQDWDPIAFNRERGNAGAIPESYLENVNGPDGEKKHLGKHLPYVPETAVPDMPEGHIALMWGDPSKGYAQHPNARKGAEAYPRGHWYDWIRVRKAVAGKAEEVETRFTGWPVPGADGSGEYRVAGEGAIEAESGKNTVYLVKLPPDVKPGDTVRIWAHCLYHGEYVDFIEVK